MASIYMWIDVTLATCLLVGFVGGRLTGRVSPRAFKLFVLGFCIGMTWELGYFVNGPLFRSDPPYQLNVPFPGHPIMQPLLHSTWDAGIFMFGVWLVRKFVEGPHFTKFRWSELLVMLAWGQLQEFFVEFSATTARVWTFHPSPLNPILFSIEGGHITLVPQLIWFVAPIVFYLALLRMNKSR